MTCPHCSAPLVREVQLHIKACEKIELALLAEQITPTVDVLPHNWDILPDHPQKRH